VAADRLGDRLVGSGQERSPPHRRDFGDGFERQPGALAGQAEDP
jgi:hypothetical protein